MFDMATLHSLTDFSNNGHIPTNVTLETLLPHPSDNNDNLSNLLSGILEYLTWRDIRGFSLINRTCRQELWRSYFTPVGMCRLAIATSPCSKRMIVLNTDTTLCHSSTWGVIGNHMLSGGPSELKLLFPQHVREATIQFGITRPNNYIPRQGTIPSIHSLYVQLQINSQHIEVGIWTQTQANLDLKQEISILQRGDYSFLFTLRYTAGVVMTETNDANFTVDVEGIGVLAQESKQLNGPYVWFVDCAQAPPINNGYFACIMGM